MHIFNLNDPKQLLYMYCVLIIEACNRVLPGHFFVGRLLQLEKSVSNIGRLGRCQSKSTP